jgi:hypothetical protein
MMLLQTPSECASRRSGSSYANADTARRHLARGLSQSREDRGFPGNSLRLYVF